MATLGTQDNPIDKLDVDAALRPLQHKDTLVKLGPILIINLIVIFLQGICYALYLDIEAKGNAGAFEQGPLRFFAYWGLPTLWVALVFAWVEKKIRERK